MWCDNTISFSPNVCRLCASVSEVVIPMFGKESEKERIDLKIKKCLPIVVREEDCKPKQVCYNCLSKLEVCMDLVEQCLAAEYKFETVLQSRFPVLKNMGAEATNILNEVDSQPKTATLPDPAIGVVPLLEPRPTRVWPEELEKTDHNAGNTLTVQHDGGVIVLSKVDADTVGHHSREDCQDILLMVELKYKDVSETQQTTITKVPAVAYTIESQGSIISKAQAQSFGATEANKIQTVSYTNEGTQKTHALAYTIDPQAVSSTKTYTLTYNTDSQSVMTSKSQTISYTEAQPVTVSKIQAFSYTADAVNKPQTVTYPTDGSEQKTQLVYAADPQQPHSLEPVALTKGNILSYTTEQGGTLAGKTHLLTYTTEPPSAGEAYSSEQPSDGNKTPSLTYATELQTNTLVNKMELMGEASEVQTDGKTLSFPNESDVLSLNSNITQQTPIIIDSDKYKSTASEENANTSRPEKRFSCTICGKSFMRRTNLNAHMGVRHTHIRPHVCDQCGKGFVLRWDLTLHQRIHAGLFSCEFCNKAFTVQGKLDRHRRTHTGERPFPCTTCGKAFGDKRNLESHQRTHSGERPYVCGICGRSFRVRSHLSDHRRVHSQEAPFICDICGKSFKWKTNLNIHLKVHAGERFPCNECGREFKRRADLVKHRRSHSGDRPHVCGICAKGYGDKAMLQKHMKSHSEHKPFSCDICGKSFHFHWYLTAHKKTHADEGSFNCGQCGKVFNKRGNLLSHAKCHIVDVKNDSAIVESVVIPQETPVVKVIL
ncbi:hypothetical protein L9F63_003872 [Diploptera punctata]|uniref:Uncharacterized protein n=1 Tax=Diploptera punctata TaxID=6984 RepID=A0AAD8E984_DIPPU|nr:hypothetical protein L9F63_003872 [Diploptera punctata]